MEEDNDAGVDTVRTTIQLPEPLWAHAKAVSARQGCPLHEVVTEALNEWLPANFDTEGVLLRPGRGGRARP